MFLNTNARKNLLHCRALGGFQILNVILVYHNNVNNMYLVVIIKQQQMLCSYEFVETIWK